MTLVAELLNVQNMDTILIIYLVVALSNLLRLLFNARWAITTLKEVTELNGKVQFSSKVHFFEEL